MTHSLPRRMGWLRCFLGDHRWSAGPIDTRYCLDCGIHKEAWRRGEKW